MGSRFTIAVPQDYVLRRDACSYGYFVLDPNFWDTRAETFTRVLDLSGGPARVTLHQRPKSSRGEASGAALSGVPLTAAAGRALSRKERDEAKRLITRMLRLDEDESVIAEFHAVDPRWRASGRGRLMRSPTFFEDVIKTVTSCNVTWPGTVTMNRRLCEVVGRKVKAAAGSEAARRAARLSGMFTFPSPRQLAKARPATLRARCRAGYRDRRIVELATLFASGEIDPAWFEDTAVADAPLHAALLKLPGIGPYAAANLMQLLGRYHRLPLDTESVRHGKMVLGMTGSDAQIMRRMHDHFAPFGRHAFRSYWFELWAYYEKLKGPSWTWERETTGTSFTASQLR